MEKKKIGKKRILTLSQFYCPEPNIKSNALAKGMQENGFDVISLTGFPNYPDGKIYNGYKQRLWQRETINGVHVIRCPLYMDQSKSKIKRILNYFSFAFSSTFVGLCLLPKIDLIWAYNPPLTIGIPALILSKLKRTPFVFEIMDLWPETLTATGMAPPTWVMKILAKFGMLVYRHAAAVLVVTNGFKKNLVSKGVPEEKITVIPNWADENLFKVVSKDQTLLRELGLDKSFNVMFAGNIGEAQGLENLINATFLIKNPKIKICIIGGGTALEGIKELCRQKKVENIVFVDRKPMEEMNRYLGMADVLLIHLRKDPLFKITIPSKTTAYLAVGKPILGVGEGDAQELIEVAKAGMTCPPEEPQLLAKKIEEFYHLSQEKMSYMGQNGREYFLKNLQKSVLIEKYLEVFVKEMNEK